MLKSTYYIGLDMGTSSVGWAVTTPDYQLVRRKGKDMWGVRLFKEAETSAGRRTNRVARRRHEREKTRLGYVRNAFADEIIKVDPSFYQRLDESKLYQEDRTDNQPYTLFHDADYTDKDYYREFPTIFHLRKALIENKKSFDVRLVYLAVHNLFKHRGHFLNANIGDEGIGNLSEVYAECRQQYQDIFGEELYGEETTNWLENILTSKQFSRSAKHAEILSKIGITKSGNKQLAEMWKLVCGLTGTIAVVFNKETIDEEKQKFSISFSDGNFEEKCADVEGMLSDEAYELFLTLKSMHDWAALANIMKGENTTYEYLSFARVASYEKHKKDLEVLKNLYKAYLPDEYDNMFRIMADNNYSAYVGSVNSQKQNEKVVRRGAKFNQEEFTKALKKHLELMPDCDEKKYVLEELDKGTFLPKQITNANGVIPNQVHKRELKAILKNAETYLPFLKEKDESGLTVSERIISLYEFQIPYYVGPIAPYVGYKGVNGNLWSVRKENGKVYPWNFEEKVDTKESAEKFIYKMVRHCTYLNAETVLPKNSLLYEKFMVLNELNNLQINGEKPPVALKQDIFNDLFLCGKKVTRKKLISYLKVKGIISANEEVDIAGIDGDFTNTCVNYARFAQAFKTEKLTQSQIEIAEKIIYWSTIYGDTKKFLKQKITEAYGDVLSEEFIKRVVGLRFKDWGKLSKELLTLEGADVETGEVKTVLNRMWDENHNLMELIMTDRYNYVEKIKDQQKKIDKALFEFTYEDLEELYISAPVRRMIWQTVQILQEIVKVMGCEPARIFVEMAKSPEKDKTRKDSRKKKFLELYKNCKKEEHKWTEEISSREEADFRSKKLFLYYTQKGRCMYTGDAIDLADLFNDNLYDIDHIYPRHFTKDDSLENNCVLVRKEKNAHKLDVFPIESDIKKKCLGLWNALHDGGFITDEKYKRLTRNTEFTDEERVNFIARQLVETRQGTKVITDIFEKTFPNAEIVYSKAANVSAFRQKYDMNKCRVVNDFHHANDAYLNVVVGNVYYTKFTKNPANFIKEYNRDPVKNNYHMYKLFDYNVKRGDDVAWCADGDKSITIVKSVMRKNTPLVTRMVRCAHGGLFDQNLIGVDAVRKANGEGYTSIKADGVIADVCKYGGYNKATGAYFFLAEYSDKKGNRIRSLETVPLYLADKLKDVDALKEYCETELGYKEVRICYKCIPMNSLLRINGFDMYLTGRTENRLLLCNAVQMKLQLEFVEYVRILNTSTEKETSEEKLGITAEKNISLYDELTNKHVDGIYAKRPNPVGNKLIKGRDTFISLSMKDQVYVLLQILSLSQLANQGADLRAIDESKKTGVSLFSKNISTAKEVYLVQQSTSGLYEREIDLLRV